jgi:CRISPR-associated protein Cas2
MAESKNYYLICYDIRDPKRWRKAYKLLKDMARIFSFQSFGCG